MSPSDEVVEMTVGEVTAPEVVAPVVVEEAPKKSKKINLSRPGVADEPASADPRVRRVEYAPDGVTIIETY